MIHSVIDVEQALARRSYANVFGASLASVFGSLMVLLALVIIWLSRIDIGHDVYVSELGAPGQRSTHWFQAALLLIVVGGSLIAYAARGIRSRLPVLGAWTPAVSLWISCGFFLVDSQVTCTSGCPLPVGSTFTWQDFVHTLAAVLAFVAACLAMLQVAFADGHRGLARFSLATGVAVALISGAGGILSLARFEVGIGSRLELAATTIAIGWVVVLGIAVAARPPASPPAR